MAYNDLARHEKTITYGTLLAGAIIFAFPFIWLVATSVKVEREMAADEISVFPRTPKPRRFTPYIDTREFDEPKIPDGVPENVWGKALPELKTLLAAKAADWDRRTPGAAEGYRPSWKNVSTEDYAAEMTEGLLLALSGRISDVARRKAVEVERTLRSEAGEESAGVSDYLLGRDLSPKAIHAGARAIVDDVNRLVDDRTLRETFDRVYRRFCLGDVRVRTHDFISHQLFNEGDEWRAVQGMADLEPGREKAIRFQQVSLTFDPGKEGRTAVFALTPDAETLAREDIDPARIDRTYVSYRGDSSWAAVDFEIVAAGRLYRSNEMVNLYERDWVEQELRWPGGEGDPMERRVYQVLEDAGPAPADSPPLEIRVRIRKSSLPGAWLAKLTRNYRLAFREVPFARYIATSFALTILNIILAIFSCTLTAYAFARLKWPGRDICFGILLATMMIPPQVTMIPGFLVFKWLGWYNTLIPLWLPAAFGAPFFVFLLRQFFKNIPVDLEDAARIDGCGFLRIYWHVMLPLVKPTIATIAIFTFMGVWNNFMGPLIYVNDDRLFPLALGMFKFQLRSGSDVGLMMAGSFVMTLPIIILFFFVQRYFIQGISLTGMKG